MSDDTDTGDELQGLRPADFRSRWAQTMARTQTELTLLSSAVNDQQTELRRATEELARLVPGVVIEAKKKLDECAASLDQARDDLATQQHSFLADLATAQRALADARLDLDRRRGGFAQEQSDLRADRTSFAESVRDFSRLGVWERIFMPRALKDIVNKYSRRTV